MSRSFFCFWILSAILLGVNSVVTPLSRTQEARVLETAREMLGAGSAGWIVPRVNGEVRLQKPPLAYWLSAISFMVFGVHEWSGRVPMALAGWLTLLMVYRLGRELFDDRAGLAAAGLMLGTLLFNRFAPLAETDVLAMFFVTLGCYAVVRCWRTLDPEPAADALRSRFGWSQIVGIAVAGALLAKGPPAVFPGLFLIALAVATARWRLLWVFPMMVPIAVALAVPWFILVAQTPEAQIIRRELGVALRGGGHSNPFWYHLPTVVGLSAPWSGVLVLAVGAALTHWREQRVRLVLIWAGCILVGLSVAGQKQPHYLMLVLPPLALIMGWAVARAFANDRPLRLALSWVMGGTFIVVALAVIGLNCWREFSFPTVGISLPIALCLAGGLFWLRRGELRRAFVLGVGTSAVLLALIPAASKRIETNYDEVANAIIQQFGHGPYVFYQDPNLSLVFQMRMLIPVIRDEDELRRILLENPATLVITDYDAGAWESSPPGTRDAFCAATDEKMLEVHVRKSTDSADR